MTKITAEDIEKRIIYPELIDKIRNAFCNAEMQVPERMVMELPGNNTSLLMPAWDRQYYGLKQIMVCPANSSLNLPTVSGTYNLFDIINGINLSQIDAPKLTAVRTAATSVLAATIIKKKASSLLIMGAGVVAEELINAYAAMYNLNSIYIWNRNKTRGEKLVKKYSMQYPVLLCNDLEQTLAEIDIVSCATHSESAILPGNSIKKGAHIDLIGSYQPHMREADDDVIKRSDIYIDDYKALEESGDLCIPIKNGLISKSDIRATLFQLSKEEIIPSIPKDLSMFKSVGNAIEDIAAAIYFYEKK